MKFAQQKLKTLGPEHSMCHRCTGCNNSRWQQSGRWQSQPEPNAEIVEKISGKHLTHRTTSAWSDVSFHAGKITASGRTGARSTSRRTTQYRHKSPATASGRVIQTPWRSWGMVRDVCDSRAPAACCCREAARTYGAATACPYSPSSASVQHQSSSIKITSINLTKNEAQLRSPVPNGYSLHLQTRSDRQSTKSKLRLNTSTCRVQTYAKMAVHMKAKSLISNILILTCQDPTNLQNFISKYADNFWVI